MATIQDILDAFSYYIGNGGYYEKASAKNLRREVSDFAANGLEADGQVGTLTWAALE
jgi:hypothetical protein